MLFRELFHLCELGLMHSLTLGNHKDLIKPTKIYYEVFLPDKASTCLLKICFGNNFSLISHDDMVKQL